MPNEIETGLYVFVLATFVGFEIIRRVPPLFHTPLMSLTNAVAGISLVGSLVVAGADQGVASTILGTVAVTTSTINVVGGFLITDRMLKMFKPRTPAPKQAGAAGAAATTGAAATRGATATATATAATAKGAIR